MSLSEVAMRKAVAIDDSKTVLASVRHALEGLGFRVTTATDPSELKPETCQEASLIVVDVNMEQVFGDDVVTFLRESWQVNAPIFLYSSIPISELEKRDKGGRVRRTHRVWFPLPKHVGAPENDTILPRRAARHHHRDRSHHCRAAAGGVDDAAAAHVLPDCGGSVPGVSRPE